MKTPATSISHPPFQYFGGKWEMGHWLADNIPAGHTLVITHGGAGSPLWHIEPGRYAVEVLNDIDRHIQNFFRMCRENPHELAFLLALTPHHRAEYREAVASLKAGTTVDAVESARRFAVVARQSMAGAFGRAWSSVVTHSRRGMASSCSRWLHVPNVVLEVAARVASVQIECMDAVALIERYDRPETVFYLDPPYHHDTRQADVYAYEMGHEQHVTLLDCVVAIKGKATISGYSHPLYEERLASWRRV